MVRNVITLVAIIYHILTDTAGENSPEPKEGKANPLRSLWAYSDKKYKCKESGTEIPLILFRFNMNDFVKTELITFIN